MQLSMAAYAVRMKKNTTAQGLRAQALALAHLRAAGLVEVACNVRCGGGELDLIMWHDRCLVFVEVRLRRSDTCGGALASVDQKKQQRLRRAAAAYLQQCRAYDRVTCRFDVVGVSADNEITWIHSAF